MNFLTKEQIATFSPPAILLDCGYQLHGGSRLHHTSQTWANGDASSKIGVTFRGSEFVGWIDNCSGACGRGIVSLVCYLKSYPAGIDGYKKTGDYLKDLSGKPQSHSVNIVHQVVSIIGTTPAAELSGPHWPVAKRYLMSRGLNGALLDDLNRQGKVGAKLRGNYVDVVFSRENGGYFWRGTNTAEFEKRTGKKFRGTVGAKECGPFAIGSGTQKVIFAESCIDAISLMQLHQDARIVAIGGSGVPLTRSLIDLYADKDSSIFAGFNNDEPGFNYARQLKLLAPHSIQLTLNLVKDWNEFVQKKM